MKRIIVLGAGISGLSVAWYLHKKFQDKISLTVLEQADRVGGWIKTIRQDGFLFELGPHSLRSESGDETLAFIKELGLEDQVIFANAHAKRRFLYANKRLRSLPYSFASSLCSPITYQFIAALIRDRFFPKTVHHGADETIETFCKRRFGRGATENFIDPLVSGIYAGDLSQLSVNACFPRWVEFERCYGSVFKGFSKTKRSAHSQNIYSFQNGMETLPKHLGQLLKKYLRLSCGVSEIRLHADRFEVLTTTRESLQADYLISTLPTSVLSDLLEPHCPNGAQLIQMPAASVVVASLGYKRSVLERSGFGYLIPSKEQETVLGMIWDSSIFPEQNSAPNETRLTVMIGGSRHPKISSLSDVELYRLAVDATRQHLGVKQEPDVFHLEKSMQAIPQYLVGHAKRIEAFDLEMRKLSPNFLYTGSGFHGVSLSDNIKNAKKLVDHLSV